MNRRVFLAAAAANLSRRAIAGERFDAAAFDRARVLRQARLLLKQNPVTVTAAQSPRSAGGLHDFFSEGDYWWPDPKNPSGPYVQRDGLTNLDNFVAHRQSLMKLSVAVPALTAAWKLTREKAFAEHAARHVRAWFVDEATRMNPNLQFAQAIHGKTSGRGTGVIDTIHLVEVARAIPWLAESRAMSSGEFDAARAWFADYLNWMSTSPNGIEERDTKNNHTTCWVMQAAAFASLAGNRPMLLWCANRFRSVIVPGQIAPDGRLPLELARTKPYGYCLFNLDALATICRIVSADGDDLWNFVTPDGRGMKKAVEYMFPYIADKRRWPLPPDVMYDEYWPMRQAALLFGGLAWDRAEYLAVWKKLPAESGVDEVIRNYFIRQPVLWV